MLTPYTSNFVIYSHFKTMSHKRFFSQGVHQLKKKNRKIKKREENKAVRSFLPEEQTE